MHTEDILNRIRLENTGVPIYVQLREQILRLLGAGALSPGDLAHRRHLVAGTERPRAKQP